MTTLIFQLACAIWHEKGNLQNVKKQSHFDYRILRDIVPFYTTDCSQVLASQNLLKQCIRENIPFDDKAISEAIVGNHFESVKCLYKHGCPLNNACLSIAIYQKNLKILEWLHEQKCPSNGQEYLSGIHHDNLQFFDWLYEHGYPLTGLLYFRAACEQKFETVKWLYNHNLKNGNISDYVFVKAAECGNIEFLEWTMQRGFSLLGDLYICASCGNSDPFEIVKWLYDNNCPFPNSCEFTENLAMHKYSHKTLLWALRHGFKKSENVCFYLLDDNDNNDDYKFEMLKKVYNLGCPIDFGGASCIIYDSSNEKMKEWAFDIWGFSFDDFLMSHDYINDQKIFDWLQGRGFVIAEEVLEYHIRSGNRVIVERMCKDGCPIDEWLFYTAAEEGQTEILDTVHKSSNIPLTKWTLHAAYKENCKITLKWLFSKLYSDFKRCSIRDKVDLSNYILITDNITNVYKLRHQYY